MGAIMLFSDGSVNPQSKVGYGAYLAVPEDEYSLEALKKLVKTKRFEDTTSTKLELETLLWALQEIKEKAAAVQVFTDSQNIVGLMARRSRYEKNDYRTKMNKPIINSKLYQEFYSLTDQMECEFKKLAGHKQSHRKTDIERLFTLVDRASRKALRGSDDSTQSKK